MAKVQEVFAIGTFNLSDKSPVLFPGGVYAFFTQLTESEALELHAESSARGLANIPVEEFLPVFDNLYVLYWGKDKSIGTRPYQHFGNPSGTGAIRLSTYKSLANKEIICANIIVSDFNIFEVHLQHKYPQLLKTTKKKQ